MDPKNQPPQPQANIQEFDQRFNPLTQVLDPFRNVHNPVQAPPPIPNQGSYPGLNSNIPPPISDVDNVENGQNNNSILSSLEYQYISNFFNSFLMDSDAELINNNDTLPNPPPGFDNINDGIKNQLFPIQDPELFYSVVNDMSMPPTANEQNVDPTAKPSVTILPPHQNTLTPSPEILQNELDVIPNANPTNNYLNPSNKNTPDIKSQLNSENLNKPYDPLDPKKFTLFSNSMNIPKNEETINDAPTIHNNNNNNIISNPPDPSAIPNNQEENKPTTTDNNSNNNNNNNSANPPTRGRRGRPRLSESKKNNIDSGAKNQNSKYKRKRKITAMLTPSQQSKLETLNTIYNVNTIGKNKRGGNASKTKENNVKASTENADVQELSNASSNNSSMNEDNSVSSVKIKDENNNDPDSKTDVKKQRKQTKELLTEEEKRANHIASEKKRRNLIRLGFQELTDLVPCLSSGVGVDGSLTPFNNSKSTILFKAIEYIKQLEMRNKELTQQLNTLQRKICIDEHIYSVAAVNAVAAAAAARQQNQTLNPNPAPTSANPQALNSSPIHHHPPPPSSSLNNSNPNIPNMYAINHPSSSTTTTPSHTNYPPYAYNNQLPPPPNRASSTTSNPDQPELYDLSKFNI